MGSLPSDTQLLARLGESDGLLSTGRLPSPEGISFRVQHKVLFAEGPWQSEAILLAWRRILTS